MTVESFYNIVTLILLQVVQGPQLIMDGVVCSDVDRWYLHKLWFVGILEEVSFIHLATAYTMIYDRSVFLFKKNVFFF